jgi:hypothetical protein
MTKEETIAAAYGNGFDTTVVDINGWSRASLCPIALRKNIHFEVKIPETETLLRPISLQGIENNNGWTRINTLYDLPSAPGETIIFRYADGVSTNWASENVIRDPEWHMRYSHFRIKENYLDPIY